MRRHGRIRVGASGWEYRHWRGAYYPPALEPSGWLAHYAADFDCVELANTFHVLPEPAVLDRWRESVPRGFAFATVAPGGITHQKKLKGCENLLQTTLARLARLGETLGPVLFQLPPRWHVNARRLAAFLEALPRGPAYAFELRDRSWHVPEVIDLLARHDAAFCVHDFEGPATALHVTAASHVYLRLHGPAGGHTGNYRSGRLRTWAGRAQGWARDGRDVFVIFEDDERAWAVRNARRMLAFLAPDGPA